jgi:hypothetical protein
MSPAVPRSIVHELEAIEVNEHYGELALMSLRLDKRMLLPVASGRHVGYIGSSLRFRERMFHPREACGT